MNSILSKIPGIEKMLALVSKISNRLTPAHIVALSFAAGIAIGCILLMFPFCHSEPGSLSLLDSLFTATSAVCVTGLIVVDTGTFFSAYGQIILIFLIQVGGIGIMTFSSLFALLFRREMGMKSAEYVQASLDFPSRQDLIKHLKSIALLTVLFESVGFLLLATRFIPRFGVGKGCFVSLFHSISAFCNAGFSVFTKSLADYAGDYMVNFTVIALILLGGVGYIVIDNMYDKIFGRKGKSIPPKLSIQSKVVLWTSLLLIVVPVPFFYMAESGGSLSGSNASEKILSSVFQIITPRTAGFNTIEIGTLSSFSIVMLIVLMFIGGSPGSTAGGIKTTTFAALIAMIKKTISRKQNVELFRRTVTNELLFKVVTIVVLSVGLITASFMLLLLTEWNLPPEILARGRFQALLFESVSAFGTVGLSMGATPHLSLWGKLNIIFVMFAGRIGPLTLILAMSQGTETPAKYKYPESNIMIG